MLPLVTEDTIRSLIGRGRKKVILPFARRRTPKSPLAAQSAGLPRLWGRAEEAGGRSGRGARCCPGQATARVQSWKRLREATQSAQPEGTQPGSLGSGPAGPWSHCLSPRPGLGPAGFCFSPCYCCCCYCRQPRSWAPARPKPRNPTGFACPASAKVRGRGPQEYPPGGAGLAGKSRRVEGLGSLSESVPAFLEPAVCLALCGTLGIQGREREQVAMHLELISR